MPMAGMLPEPETQPSEGYGSGDATYDFEVIKLDHEISEGLAEVIEDETSHRLHQFDGWNVHLFIPERNGTMPVAIYVHGYGAPYTLAYQDSLELLAARGALVIFPEYATTVNLNETDEANFAVDYTRGMTDDPRLEIRYLMEWEGVMLAYDYLMENEYDVDFSRIMVAGHSMGGGMTVWVAGKVAEWGWGTNEMIVDMEAPAAVPKYEGEGGMYRGNLAALPNHTIVNIVGYENDHLVSPCIGMWHFERFRDRDGAGELPDASYMKRSKCHIPIHGDTRWSFS
jgi:dienelactone hydrolase